jgi:hypothetical protein
MTKPALLAPLPRKEILRLIDAACSGWDEEIERTAKDMGVDPNDLFWALDDYRFDFDISLSDLEGCVDE